MKIQVLLLLFILGSFSWTVQAQSESTEETTESTLIDESTTSSTDPGATSTPSIVDSTTSSSDPGSTSTPLVQDSTTTSDPGSTSTPLVQDSTTTSTDPEPTSSSSPPTEPDDPTSTPTSSTSTKVTLRPFVCRGEGYFPDPRDPHYYFYCERIGGNAFLRYDLKCPAGKIFNGSKCI